MTPFPPGVQYRPRPRPDQVLVFRGTLTRGMSGALSEAILGNRPIRLAHGHPGTGYSVIRRPLEAGGAAGSGQTDITFTPTGPLPEGDEHPLFTARVTPQP
jgi:hypothetical protein